MRTWRRKYQREISLEYLTEEKFYPFSTTDDYFSGEYPFTVCGDTVILYDKLLVAALSHASDYDKRNTFDIEKFLDRKMKLKKNDVFTVVDADAL